jgi:hypothetical protein
VYVQLANVWFDNGWVAAYARQNQRRYAIVKSSFPTVLKNQLVVIIKYHKESEPEAEVSVTNVKFASPFLCTFRQ